MGLEHNPGKYNQIIVCPFRSPVYDTLLTPTAYQKRLRNLKREAGFKDGVLFSGQSKEKIVRYCRLVCFSISCTLLSSTTLIYNRQENRLPTFAGSTKTGQRTHTFTGHFLTGVGTCTGIPMGMGQGHPRLIIVMMMTSAATATLTVAWRMTMILARRMTQRSLWRIAKMTITDKLNIYRYMYWCTTQSQIWLSAWR
jgi:hypothetical protein